MSAPTEECPCFMFTPIRNQPQRCGVCGDAKADHTEDGNCTVQHRLDAPYDPELTRLALEQAEEWLSRRPKA